MNSRIVLWRLLPLLGMVLVPRGGLADDYNAFRNLGVPEGLSQSTVTAIVQDHAGFIWLATQDGLDRYDGYGFQAFRRAEDNTKSLSESNITALFIDSHDTLWVGTKNGLNRYDPVREEFTRFLNRDRDPVAVYAIAEAGENALWICTQDGFFRLDTKTSVAVPLLKWDPSERAPLLFSLLRDHQGTVWVGLDRGLGTVAPDGKSVVSFRSAVLDNLVITTIYETRDHSLWLGTENGALYVLAADRKTLTRISSAGAVAGAPVTSIVQTREGALWVSTKGQGLAVQRIHGGPWSHLSAQPNYRNGLPSDLIDTMFVDSDDRLWLAFRGAGAAVLNPFAGHFVSIGPPQPGSLSLSSTVVHALLVWPDGKLWIGTENGLDVVSADRQSVHVYGHSGHAAAGLTGHIVYALFRDHRGTIWAGLLDSGLCRYRPSADDFQCFQHHPGDAKSLSDSSILAIAEGADGFLWVGTLNGGLDRFDPSNGTAIPYVYDPLDPHSLSSNTVYSVAVDPDGTVWAGTAGGGLNRLSPDAQDFTRITSDDAGSGNLASSVILDLAREGDDLWMGTSTGLHVLNTRTHEIRSWTTAEGMPSSYVDSVALDPTGALWLGTNSGLVHFDPKLGEIRETYQSSDGLPTDEFNHHAVGWSHGGMLYMGTMNGVVSFQPDTLNRDSAPLKVTLTSLASYGKPLPIESVASPGKLDASITRTSSITLPYSRPEITLEYAALDSPDPARQRYAFRILGIDDHWIVTQPGHRTIGFRPPSAGIFHVEIMALKSDGSPAGDAAALDVTVLPAPWFSPWALFVYAILILALVATFATRFWLKIVRERREGEHARIQETRLQRALRASGEAAWDADGRTISINCPDLMTLLGYEDVAQPIIRHAFLQLVHPDDRSRMFGQSSEQARTTGNIGAEFRARRKDGEYRWISMRGQVIERDEAGSPVISVGTMKDITEDKDQETILLLAAHSMDYASDPVALLDQEQRIIRVSRNFEKVFGYSEAELLGLAFGHLEATEDGHLFEDFNEPANKTMEQSVTAQLRHKSGELLSCQVKLVAIHDHRSKHTYYICIPTPHRRGAVTAK